MKNTLYETSVPLFIRHLKNVDAQLEKAIVFAEERKANPEKFLEDRIFFDQFPLVRQIQIMTDIAKRTAGYIAGKEIPKYDDTEKSIAEIKIRIQKTITFLETISPEDFDGKEEILIPMSWMPTKGLRAYTGMYHYTIPNFLFHATLAYEILRKNGVILGKADYLGLLPFEDVVAQ